MKKVYLSTLIALLAINFCTASASDTSVAPMTSDHTQRNVFFGLGFGLHYGGIGIKAEYTPFKRLGVFGSLGYNFYNIGANAGVTFRPLPDKRIQPVLQTMYGYNGVINISATSETLRQYGLEDVNKTYYGFSVSLGGELLLGKGGSRLHIGVCYPFRSKAFVDNYERVENNPHIRLDSRLLPVTFSIGFNWALK